MKMIEIDLNIDNDNDFCDHKGILINDDDTCDKHRKDWREKMLSKFNRREQWKK